MTRRQTTLVAMLLFVLAVLLRLPHLGAFLTCNALLAANLGEVAKYREGKTSLLGWFMGQVMKETRGTANPDLVRKLLVERLSHAPTA